MGVSWENVQTNSPTKANPAGPHQPQLPCVFMHFGICERDAEFRQCVVFSVNLWHCMQRAGHKRDVDFPLLLRLDFDKPAPLSGVVASWVLWTRAIGKGDSHTFVRLLRDAGTGSLQLLVQEFIGNYWNPLLQVVSPGQAAGRRRM